MIKKKDSFMEKRKIKLKPSIKKVLTILTVIVILLMGVLLAKSLMLVPEETVTKTLYECQLLPTTNYSVTLIENELFQELLIGEGKQYIKALVSSVPVKFNLSFKASEDTKLRGEYSTKIIINGFQGSEKNKKIIWQKEDILVANRKLTSQGKTYDGEIKLNVFPQQYENFVQSATENLGISLSSEIIVNLDGKLIAECSDGEVELPFKSNVTIPLFGSMYTITKNEGNVVSESITKSETIQGRPKIQKVVAFLILLIIGIVALLIIRLGTEAPTEFDIMNSKLKSVLRKYGSRISATLSDECDNAYIETFEIKSMVDLVKISDELQKPIIYKIDKNFAVADSRFYVIESHIRYVHIVT